MLNFNQISKFSDSSTSSPLTGLDSSWQSEKLISSMPVDSLESGSTQILTTTNQEDNDADKTGNANLKSIGIRKPSFSDPDDGSSHLIRKRFGRKIVDSKLTQQSKEMWLPFDKINSTEFNTGKKKRLRKRRVLMNMVTNDENKNLDLGHTEPSLKRQTPLFYSSSSCDDETPLNMNSLPEVDTPVTCGKGHDHLGQSYVDLEIPLSVNALFQCVLTDSAFFHNLSKSRGTFNMVQSNWPKVDQWGSGSNVTRTITYTLALKHKVGPRTCSVVEEQVINDLD